eukprot:g14068.t1
MEDWSVDYINTCCTELFAGKVTCELSSSKGRILRSCCSFKQGDLIFQEPPLHIVEAEKSNEAFLVDRAYQPLWYWAALCSLTSEELPQTTALQPVSPEQQRRLLCLYHEPITEASAPVLALAEELHLPNALKVEELLRCWILNCFEAAAAGRGGGLRLGHEHSDEPEGYSAYFVSSFMSHSCKPNAIWHEGPDAVHVVRARLDIEEGDEICISYLSEEMLMDCALQRKRALKKTKLFLCTCERCEGPDGTMDSSRGFRCPYCGACGIYPPPCLVAAQDIFFLSLRCGWPWVAFQQIQTEKQMRVRIQHLDEDSFMQLSEEDVRQLQEMLGDRASGALGPQHWLCERLWTLLVPWLDAHGSSTEALQVLESRVGCQSAMFPWPNATRAWTMQKYCRLLLRHYKATSQDSPNDDRRARPEDAHASGCQEKGKLVKKLSAAAPNRRLLARAVTLQEEALRLLTLLFGEGHRYATRAGKKLRRLSAMVERARPGAAPEGAAPEGAAPARCNGQAPSAKRRHVVADFYGGESAHGRELRLHAGGSVAWGGLFAAFPLGTVHRRSRKEEIELVHRSLVRFFKQWPGGKQGNSFPHAFAAAARVGWFDGLLEVWESYLTNTSDPKCRLYSNGMVLGCGGTGLENVGGAAFASEMLLSTAGGVLEVFPAPLDTVAAFRLRAPGPLLVTAQMAPGHHVTVRWAAGCAGGTSGVTGASCLVRG